MPRPNVQEERREQILRAFERCVARYGLEGARLELVAEEAGLARALIRHNVGNREDLVDALVERFLKKSSRTLDLMIDHLPKERRIEAFIDLWLDGEMSDEDEELMYISEALIDAADDDPALARKMRGWLKGFIRTIEVFLQQERPDADQRRVAAVAAGLTAIFFNVDSLSPLGPMPGIRDGLS